MHTPMRHRFAVSQIAVTVETRRKFQSAELFKIAVCSISFRRMCLAYGVCVCVCACVRVSVCVSVCL